MNSTAASAPRRALILETSHRVARVAVAAEGRIAGERRLDEARRHARDLAPAIQELLAGQAWTARSLDAVFVSRGPGSYTGLRVGIMSAKTLAYATGCALLAVDTFAALARQAPDNGDDTCVIADAQQDKLYVQRFRGGAALAPLAIETVATLLASLRPEMQVLGPGLEKAGKSLPSSVRIADPELWFPQPASLLEVGLKRWRLGERDDPFAVEPVYLRASSAEEKWKELGR
jgi:tRNA threonylcarbamoyladenosine biosynthesis protein TsaB